MSLVLLYFSHITHTLVPPPPPHSSFSNSPDWIYWPEERKMYESVQGCSLPGRGKLESEGNKGKEEKNTKRQRERENCKDGEILN